jgi:predicted PurR-regulated permease PerM
VFGFSGFVIGPVIAALFLSVWEIYTEPQPATKAKTGA